MNRQTPAADQAATSAQAAAPDRRWKMVQAEIRRHGGAPHALIEVLHAVQGAYGYLDKAVLAQVAEALRLPLSKVYGVATFYHYFSLKPPGEHTCVVCTGTACYIKNADGLTQAVSEAFEVKPGETTADGKLSLLTARCVGACGIAPVAVVDGQVLGKLSPEALRERLEEVR